MPPEADPKTGTDPAATTTEEKPEVSFKTRAEFHAEIERKTKPAITKALEASNAKILEQLGIESFEDLGALKEKLVASEKTVTEAEKLKNAHDRTAKDLEKATKRTGELMGRLKGIARRDALAPFTGRFVDPEDLVTFASSDLEVDDDGVVSVKDGGKLDDLVEGLLKRKPHLRNPAHKEGAGTTANEPKAKGAESTTSATAAATTTAAAANGTNGQQHASPGHKIMAELAARNALPKMPGP